MSRRIDAQPYRLGNPETTDPEKIEELRQRVEKHARLTSKRTGAVFSEVLKKRMKKLRGEDDEDADDRQEQQKNEGEQKEALLALHPGQQASLANKKKVIIKG